MSETGDRPKPTIHQATHRLLLQLAKDMKPVSQLAKEVALPDEPHPMDTVIELLNQVVGGIGQIQSQLETMESRLSESVVKTSATG